MILHYILQNILHPAECSAARSDADIPRPPDSAGKLLSIRDYISSSCDFCIFFCLMALRKAKKSKRPKGRCVEKVLLRYSSFSPSLALYYYLPCGKAEKAFTILLMLTARL